MTDRNQNETEKNINSSEYALFYNIGWIDTINIKAERELHLYIRKVRAHKSPVIRGTDDHRWESGTPILMTEFFYAEPTQGLTHGVKTGEDFACGLVSVADQPNKVILESVRETNCNIFDILLGNVVSP